jgi:hypothetical protein
MSEENKQIFNAAVQIYAAMYVSDNTPTKDEEWRCESRIRDAVRTASTLYLTVKRR